MKIIPGAAYLEGTPQTGQEVLVADCFGELLTNNGSRIGYVPSGLVLLWAPGDEVIETKDSWAAAERGVTKHGLITKIYRRCDV